MSTALENEDRDFVTEDDLRAGNELVWVKNNNRLTVRVARAEAEDQQKSFLEDSNSSSDDDGDCVAKNGHSEKDGKGKKKRGNTNTKLSTNIFNKTDCDPPSTSKEAQAESQSKPINQSPEYFVNKNGVDLLKVRGTNVVKYALGLLDALYTEEELKQSSFVPVGKSTTSVKPPLSPERMKLFEDCLKQKFSASELKENVEAIRQSCTQKYRDKGKILGMILGQGGKILDKILGMILVHGSDVLEVSFPFWPARLLAVEGVRQKHRSLCHSQCQRRQVRGQCRLRQLCTLIDEFSRVTLTQSGSTAEHHFIMLLKTAILASSGSLWM
eukprot:Em0014g93a